MRDDEADRAIARGDFWRAKQILEGRIGLTHFDPDLLRRYGLLLLLMGDLLVAGRFLYLSGAREEESKQAINLFLSRYPRAKPKRFLAHMPSMIRRQSHLADYLASAEFEQSGWSPTALRSIRPRERTEQPTHSPSPLRRRLGQGIAIVVVLTIAFLIIVGAVTIGTAVGSWLTRVAAR